MNLSMIALGVRDTARSVRFYRDTLGMQLIGQPGEVTIVQSGGMQIALNRPLANACGDAIVGAVEVIFSVESVAAAHTKLVERGCPFSHPPHEIYPGMCAATFTDPDGHRLTFLGPR